MPEPIGKPGDVHDRGTGRVPGPAICGRRGPLVGVIDHGSGNLHSVCQALQKAGAHPKLVSDPRMFSAVDAVVLPGVGALGTAMANLRRINGVQQVQELVQRGERPVLGICVGHQMFFEQGTERDETVDGLGCLPGTVVPMPTSRLPHMGWNTVHPPADTALFTGISGERFYFVHSCAVVTVSPCALAHVEGDAAALAHTGDDATDPETGTGTASPGAIGHTAAGPESAHAMTGRNGHPVRTTTTCHDGCTFVSAIECGRLCSTQFHPEKSGPAGIQLLRNWLAMV
ncbi:imidazole glycerol phosphate synthase subunit HisH [Cutibacterium granulosum]|uniref:Imidazole glycerol phosphate synthase subunit hisH n=1 Tax=Cutibacterium granulosum TM11 TaxID=1292373 RepID=A0ACB4UN31_9ACTN|nr:imidazole glycerol phosphate synthase subunit HisH [Cutibacterium granulosum]ERF65447.1 Imidazole glycerol phosphate synthase subunit hisH [Cutibacterium granulosum TM11]